MYNLVYNYPRNHALLEAYHGYYKQHPTWEPQGDKGIKKGGRSTINIDGVEYYKPRSYVGIPYNHSNMKAMEKLEGGISFSDVKKTAKKVGKTVAKKALSTALDQIPKGTAVVGATLGALGAELLGPEAVPVGAFVGKKAGEELGKVGRQYIKKKTGYGVYKELAKAKAKASKGKQKLEKLTKGGTKKSRPTPTLPKRPTKKSTKTGGKTNPWIQKVKSYQEQHGVSYKQALQALKK